jgi:hypothetical protein
MKHYEREKMVYSCRNAAWARDELLMAAWCDEEYG